MIVPGKIAKYDPRRALWLKARCCTCSSVNKQGLIFLTGYAENRSDIVLCKFCAIQLARKLLEDVCDLEGDRHG